MIALAAAAKHDGALLAMGLVKLGHDRKHSCCLVSQQEKVCNDILSNVRTGWALVMICANVQRNNRPAQKVEM